jgi:hypothetical protein
LAELGLSGRLTCGEHRFAPHRQSPIEDRPGCVEDWGLAIDRTWWRTRHDLSGLPRRLWRAVCEVPATLGVGVGVRVLGHVQRSVLVGVQNRQFALSQKVVGRPTVTALVNLEYVACVVEWLRSVVPGKRTPGVRRWSRLGCRSRCR